MTYRFKDPRGEADVDLDCVVLEGSANAATLWVQGALHGDEIDGVVAIGQLAKSAAEGDLGARVVAVPLVNVPAVRHGRAACPIDGKNLNRCFPGDPRGTWTDRFAHWLHGVILDSCDVMLDLHGGGQTTSVTPFCFCQEVPGATREQSLRLAEGCSVPFPSFLPEQFVGTLLESASRAGVPGLLLEAGWGPSWTLEGARQHTQWVHAALSNLAAVLSAPSSAPALPTVARTAVISPTEGGIVRRRSVVGAEVSASDVVLELTEPGGDLVEQLCSPFHRAHVLSVSSLGFIGAGAFAALLRESSDGGAGGTDDAQKGSRNDAGSV